ncbi:MAG: phage tail sheath C-terminal domain-containing protein [Ignavibacteria bacterium]|jgi:phage tail sheath protein FI
MATYKTPDVYVEEISIFPPSVAEVETAIPAFIGYTEKATEFEPDDLRNVPTKVTSLLDYQELFGGAPPVSVNEIKLDENNTVSSFAMESTYYMYDSLRMFFNNGGGKCYIVSVGSYGNDVTKAKLEGGITTLKKYDEPTMILSPDAVLLESDDLYSVQQKALSQCADLMDRFSIFDLMESKEADSTFDWEEGVSDFRNKIGMNNLKYSAAYTPWLKTNLSKDIHYRDIKGKISRGGVTLALTALTDDSTVKGYVTSLDNAVADVDQVESDLKTLKGGEATLKAKYTAVVDDFKAGPDTAKFKAIFNFIYGVVDQIDDWAATGTLDNSNLTTDVDSLIAGTLRSAMETLIAYDGGADSALTGNYKLYTDSGNISVTSSNWGNIFVEGDPDNPAANNSIYTGSTNSEKQLSALKYLANVFTLVNTVVAQIVSAADQYETTYEDALYEAHPVFKTIIKKLSSASTILPPSGAVAGLYAYVDETRGVWKAPANVSISSVTGVTESIDNEEQEDLNIDVTAGKSINAIRAFTGKGILVWGARTLAGNDNEWRYIPVRRFFNMVEESVKKSTYWAVFEPNDANTWIKVKAMIENYLIQKWKDGALQGAKPDEAFFVKVGLGTTMTQQDILEGRMNVEIGMAVVRPAEFIILKFSHKMIES